MNKNLKEDTEEIISSILGKRTQKMLAKQINYLHIETDEIKNIKREPYKRMTIDEGENFLFDIKTDNVRYIDDIESPIDYTKKEISFENVISSYQTKEYEELLTPIPPLCRKNSFCDPQIASIHNIPNK